MIDLTAITTALATGAPSFQQRILPEVVEAQGPDTPTVLTAVLKAALGTSQVFAERIPQENATWPACAHQLGGTERVDVDGYVITRTDTYNVQVVATSYDSLIDTCDTIRITALAHSNTPSAVDIQIADMQTGYEDDRHYSVAALAMQVTHLARNTQTLPALWVYPISEGAASNDSIGCVAQIVDEEFVVLWAAEIPAGGVSNLRSTRDEIFTTLLGKRLETGFGRIEYAGGGLAFLQNNIAFWRDSWTTTRTISGG